MIHKCRVWDPEQKNPHTRTRPLARAKAKFANIGIYIYTYTYIIPIFVCHELCFLGFRNSGCEHKGSHTTEIPDPPGLAPDPCAVAFVRMRRD